MEWTIQASAKLIQEHDIICLLYGASKPTIIRLYKDHFAVVVIAATPLNVLTRYKWPQLLQSKTQFLRDFVLVWDWESSCKNLQDHGEYEALTKTFSQALVFSRVEFERHLNEAIRLWNDIAILDDLKEYKEADERLIAAQDEYYLAAFGKMPLAYESSSEYGRTILAFAAGKGHEDIVKLLLDTIHPDVKDGQGGRTPLSLATANGHGAVVKLLLATGQVEADSKDNQHRTPIYWAAKNGHEVVFELLLAADQAKASSKDKSNWKPELWDTKPWPILLNMILKENYHLL
ncbi:hypothetical protein BPAE_0015g00190 [Botrytis paeoniae]|uniref:Uncharacterized protein n=1 Tax=Botrytis paeoniae TaxID=278948 RepID=A0A4Z1FXX1_9HELO|nr:hypothetical protein BPAE_0015g00190 [Botrytis paeoniae]